MGLALIFILNLVISFFNAYGCGKVWKQTGDGWFKAVLWCAVIMSAAGFTWCYSILLGGLAYSFHWLTPEYLDLFFKLGYVLIVPFVICSGVVILIDSWVLFIRRKDFCSGAVAAYNTYAMYRNISDAVEFFPPILGEVSKAIFSSKGVESDDAKGKALLLVIFLVILSLIMGGLTTRFIILKTAEAT